MKENIESALLEVRKSYRIINLYQTRIVDLAKVVGDFFEMDYYYRASPILGSAPDAATPPWTRWNWYFLPLQNVSFLFSKEDWLKKPKEGNWLLDVSFQADTGLDILNTSYDKCPDPLKFKDASETKTSIGIYAFRIGKVSDSAWSNWYDTIWNETNWPNLNETVASGQGPYKVDVIGKRYSLAEFATAAATQNMLALIADEFRKYRIAVPGKRDKQ